VLGPSEFKQLLRTAALSPTPEHHLAELVRAACSTPVGRVEFSAVAQTILWVLTSREVEDCPEDVLVDLASTTDSTDVVGRLREFAAKKNLSGLANACVRHSHG
jgi:hypothetical protein